MVLRGPSGKRKSDVTVRAQSSVVGWCQFSGDSDGYPLKPGQCTQLPESSLAEPTTTSTVSVERSILTIRGQRAILDLDLAHMYQVETRVLIQSVRRNMKRFPPDFLFRLSYQEFAPLISQIVISNTRGGRRSLPYAFTEQGIAMLSSVLHSDCAITVNIEIMRAFVRLRQILSSDIELARKLAALEQKYDSQFRVVFDAIRALMKPISTDNRPIGFGPRGD